MNNFMKVSKQRNKLKTNKENNHSGVESKYNTYDVTRYFIKHYSVLCRNGKVENPDIQQPMHNTMTKLTQQVFLLPI
jgi:hypothetical protein